MTQPRPQSRIPQSRATAGALTLLLAIAVVGGGLEAAPGAILSETPRGEASRELRPVRSFVRAMRELVGGMTRPELAAAPHAFPPALRAAAANASPDHEPAPPGEVDLRPDRLDLPPPTL